MSQANERALKMLATALEMEKRGRNFYARAVAECDNPAGQEIFKMLGEDEVVHVSIIKRIYDAIEGGKDWSADLRDLKRDREEGEDLGSFFAGLTDKLGKDISASSGDLEALEIGLDFERKAVAFYQDQLEDAEDDLEKKFVQEMIDEERTHVQLLADMKTYLQDPESWFQARERSLLDGA